jgi:phospholipid/cholesterol/gamma-HCH transport system substrate-binding protein
VAAIGFDDQTYQATVTFALEERFRFPTDTSAKILTSGLLGEQYVGLEAGAEEKVLGRGDLIRLTQSAVVLENLIGQFLFDKAAEGGSKP